LAWLLDRNTYNVKANWRFTAADARIKLKSHVSTITQFDGHACEAIEGAF
jgi:hypothetical protein